jgi:hypothetical protein
MKIILLLSAFVRGALIFLIVNRKRQSSKSDNPGKIIEHNLQDNPYQGLRNMALEKSAEELGLKNIKADEVYGVIMDMDIGSGIVTLVTYKTGDASMYYSTGGGVIGGGKHENVSNASKEFVGLAANFIPDAQKTNSNNLPNKDCVRFYFLTPNGKYYKQKRMADLEDKTSPWFHLFNQAHRVITQLRLTVEKK